MKALVWPVLVVAACSKKEPVPAPVVPLPVIAIAAPPSADAGAEEKVAPQRAVSARSRLSLTLRSTPPGASAIVDGRLVGKTPMRFDIEDDGRAHEFTFTLAGYAPWRLHFSPTKEGVIHATLEAAAGAADAG